MKKMSYSFVFVLIKVLLSASVLVASEELKPKKKCPPVPLFNEARACTSREKNIFQVKQQTYHYKFLKPKDITIHHVRNLQYFYILMVTSMVPFQENKRVFNYLFGKLNIKDLSKRIRAMRVGKDNERLKNMVKKDITWIKKCIEEKDLPSLTCMIKKEDPYAAEIESILKNDNNKEKQLRFLDELLK